MNRRMCPKCGKRSLEDYYLESVCRNCGYKNSRKEKDASIVNYQEIK